MAASLLFLLLLPLAPALVSSTPYAMMAKEARPVIKQSAKAYMEQKVQVQQGIASRSGQQMATDSSVALVFDLSIGTSPQKLSVVMDITTELVWAQCDACSSCIRLTPPATPTFMPNNSSSFAEVGCTSQTCQRMIPGEHGCTHDDDPCGYPNDFYGWNTSGVLATDMFTFGTTPVPGVLFGCSGDIMVPDLAGTSGVAGFSRGPLSLVSQLNISSFTYFIPPHGDAASKSFVSWTFDKSERYKKKRGAARCSPQQTWGGAADHQFAAGQMRTGGRRSSTPLLAAKKNQLYPYLYYVNLTGLQVDGQLLTAIPPGFFDVRPTGTGGVFLSSTLPVTYLEEAAYNVLRPELVRRIQSQGVAPVTADDDVNNLCFLTRDFSGVKIPGIALVFDGDSATMELKVENYFLAVADGQLTCLTILPSIGGSILGSLLQAGRTMTYDIHGVQLTFQTAAAGAPTPGLWSMIMATLLVWLLCPENLVYAI
ncbi:aspartic proteinase nepenthesin-1-like [Lolium rigidum]|uniref:aspartic proteinase nepenthesin-1-like n=1 Tax=Lolium rigidum TaxID=89674 RepID=UPI001F5C75ED|nr:aspartic proteinase nepenthesin-1-like [Lolium rigidum]